MRSARPKALTRIAFTVLFTLIIALGGFATYLGGGRDLAMAEGPAPSSGVEAWQGGRQVAPWVLPDPYTGRD